MAAAALGALVAEGGEKGCVARWSHCCPTLSSFSVLSLPSPVYPRRAGQTRNHSCPARQCSVKRRVGIQTVEIAILTLWIGIVILRFPRTERRQAASSLFARFSSLLQCPRSFRHAYHQHAELLGLFAGKMLPQCWPK